jgi:hypothetical protein
MDFLEIEPADFIFASTADVTSATDLLQTWSKGDELQVVKKPKEKTIMRARKQAQKDLNTNDDFHEMLNTNGTRAHVFEQPRAPKHCAWTWNVRAVELHLRRYCRNLVANVPYVPNDNLLFFSTKIVVNYAFAQFLFFAVADVDAKWEKRLFIGDHLNAVSKMNVKHIAVNFG